MSSITNQFKAARRCAVPLVAVTTPDAPATVDALCEAVPDQVGTGEAARPVPKVTWDVVRGLTARNDAGREAIAGLLGDLFDPTVGNPVEAFRLAAKLPGRSVFFVHLANRWLAEPAVVQGACNLRDLFKMDRRTAVLLGPTVDLPPELAGDVVVFDEPLPDSAALDAIVREQHVNAQVPPDAAQVTAAVEAVQGLPAFQVEQVVAMSIGKGGLDVPALWERKRRQIELTPGLKVHREGVTYADVGGSDTVKSFLGRVLTGQSKPAAVVFVDEIEKFMAGSAGGADSSGVSQDQLGTLLAYMQDHGAAGCLFVGPPGSGKSAVAKATGNEAGIPTIQLDLGAMKGSLVGQSEQQVRAALKVITSVSNGRSLWIATCNAIADLPPELRRRFTLGTFFFDLPDAAERAAIWKIWLAKLGLSGKRPPDEGWTGAEIRQCCDIAHRLGCPLVEAAAFVVPVSRSAADQLARLRQAAEGRFLSASKPGVYQRPAAGGGCDTRIIGRVGRRNITTNETEEA